MIAGGQQPPAKGKREMEDKLVDKILARIKEIRNESPIPVDAETSRKQAYDAGWIAALLYVSKLIREVEG